MHTTAGVEELGKPSVVLVNEAFLTTAAEVAAAKGMPHLRVVSSPVPCECGVREQVEAGASLMIDDIVAGLTMPLTPEEGSPGAVLPESFPRIAARGTLVEINEFFYRKGWTDGLPIVPPTQDAVEAMLAGTDLPREHIIGKMMPRMGKITVEKIAINAVMAGALPTYMPVLIAGLEALLDPAGKFGLWQFSTGSWSPFFIINGPVRKEVNINCGFGALSPGDIANATIGRALQLIVKNTGGAVKGVDDMGLLGNPAKYTMVIGESEEQSGWEPFHVEKGFSSTDSTVSVWYPNSFLQVMPYDTDARGILVAIVNNLPPSRPNSLMVIINPAHARILADGGWSKLEVKRFIREHARVPAHRYPPAYRKYLLQEKAMGPVDDMDAVPLFFSTDEINIIVAGGPGAFIGLLFSARIPYQLVTRKIARPARWRELVARYRDIVPEHRETCLTSCFIPAPGKNS